MISFVSKSIYYWLSKKFLFNKRNNLGLPGYLSLIGLILGVAMLVVSQSVMRGFETSLKAAVIDTTGDVQIVKRGKFIESWSQFSDSLRQIDDRIAFVARFAATEAVLSSQGKVSGVIAHGIDFKESENVLNLKKRLTEGHFPEGSNQIVIGLGLLKKMNLKVSDKIYLAVPLATPFENQGFKRQAAQYTIAGTIDFGKNDWNERLVLMSLFDLQKLTLIGDRFTGAYVKIKDSNDVLDVSKKISDVLEPANYVNNWYNINRNLIEAVELEKVVIFIVVFLIVVIAAFNISSSLYVIVRSRFKDIAILKTVGFSGQNIKRIFLAQGFIIGSVGTLLGFILGFALCVAFMWLQSQFGIISGSVYKLDRIDFQIGLTDLVIIYISTLVACLTAAYFPAKQAAQMTIMEGFRDD